MTDFLTLNFVVASTNILTNPNLIISNGFILSGSLTTGNIPVIGNSRLIENTELPFAPESPANAVGTIVNVPTINFADTNADGIFEVIAQGTGLTVNISNADNTGIKVNKVTVNQQGSGYRAGDRVIVRFDDLNDVSRQGNTSSPPNINTGGIVIGPFTEAMLEGESSPFQLNFNPSPISSSLITSSLGAGATSTLEQQLLIGGPQLALFNMFNTTVSSSLFDVNTIGSDLNEGPRSLLWTTSGSNPANAENYYSWAPESSDSNSYTNTNTPFTLERGDIIRVEGTLNTISPANVSQSTNVIQDFTVEELQPFTYTSSFSDDYNFPYLKTTQLTGVNNAGFQQIGQQWTID